MGLHTVVIPSLKEEDTLQRLVIAGTCLEDLITLEYLAGHLNNPKHPNWTRHIHILSSLHLSNPFRAKSIYLPRYPRVDKYLGRYLDVVNRDDTS